MRLVAGKSIAAGLLASLFAAGSMEALAQAKPIRMMIGFPPGGALDGAARLVAEQMTEALKRPVIVEARLGAGGALAVNTLKTSPADGNTLLIAPGSTVVLPPMVKKKPPFDTLGDLLPVAMVGQSALALAVSNTVPAKDLREYAGWVKANPASAFYSSGGAGGQTHFFGLMIADALGLAMKHVSYKGTGPAITDTVAGHVPATVQPFGALLPQHQAGKLKIIALSGARAPQAAGVVPFGDQGFPALSMHAWYAIFAATGTPPEIVEKLNAVINQGLRVESLRERMRTFDVAIQEMSTAEVGAYLRRDMERWRPVIKASGFSEDD